MLLQYTWLVQACHSDLEPDLACAVVCAVHHEHPPTECVSDWGRIDGKVNGKINGQVHQQVHEPGSAMNLMLLS